MDWEVRLADGAAAPLSALLPRIKAALRTARAEVERALPPIDVEVVLASRPAGAIPALGLGGFAPSGTRLELSFDPGNPAYTRNLGAPLRRIVAHEAHHVHRWRGPGYGERLGEALVTEGLAGQFAQALHDGSPAPPALRGVARAALRAWDDARYDHAAWFFGTGGRPRWIGYALGFALVGRHLEAAPGRDAAALVHAPAAAFRGALESLVH